MVFSVLAVFAYLPAFAGRYDGPSGSQHGMGKYRKKLPPPTVSVAAQYTHISYRETHRPNYSASALTAKVNLGIRIFQRINLAGNAFGTTYTFRKNNNEARFIGANGRVGFIPLIGASWSFSMDLGWYYTTMLVDGNAFGYKHMSGSQAFITFSKSHQKFSFGLYAKYALISNGFKVLAFSNHERAAGFSIGPVFKQRVPLLFVFDYADLKFNFKNIHVRNRSISGGISIGFRP